MQPTGPFAELGLKGLLLKALAAEDYQTPTPIQAQAIPPVLEGKDLVGIAQTGTGKTAAFALPILQRLFETKARAAQRSCLALILCPTRELAGQIHESFATYGRFMRISQGLVFGGVPIGKQVRALQSGVDVLIATPGRLLDLINRRALSLHEVQVLVLDEADHMLDLGFVNDIRKIVAMLPKKRQNLFFSATMPAAIQSLADDLLKDPVRVSVTPAARTVDKIEQKAIIVERGNKQRLLETLIGEMEMDRGIIFCRTKHGADKVTKSLIQANVSAIAIHGNKSQGQRERALADLKSGKIDFLVATDIAARGIDVDGLSHVINFDIPDVPEAYVHRIGRTARAGASGIAVSLVAPDEVRAFRDIERTTKKTVEILTHALGTVIPDRLPRAEGRGQRPGGARPQGQRFDGQRFESRGPRPAGSGYQGNRPRDDRPRDDRPQGDRPQPARYQGERPHHGAPRGEGAAPVVLADGRRPDHRPDHRPGGERHWRTGPAREQGGRDQGGASQSRDHQPRGDHQPREARPHGQAARPAQGPSRQFAGRPERGRR